MEFRVHGSANLRCEGQILIAEVVGPWNLELVDLYRREIAQYVPALAEKGAWGLILVFHNEVQCPLDAIHSIRQGAYEHAQKWNRACTSYVIAPDVAGYHVMDRLWRGIYEDIIPVRIFDTLAEAQQWTTQLLGTES